MDNDVPRQSSTEINVDRIYGHLSKPTLKAAEINEIMSVVVDLLCCPAIIQLLNKMWRELKRTVIQQHSVGTYPEKDQIYLFQTDRPYERQIFNLFLPK